MDAAKLAQCKRLTVDRFLKATLYSVAAQLLPVSIFLLFLNLNPLHPITWLLDTTRLLFSPATWLYALPLIICVAMHSVVWSKVFLSRTDYYHNRCLLILRTATKKLALLLTNALVGFCTAWLFVRILARSSSSGAAPLTAEATWSLLLGGLVMGNFNFLKARRLKLVQDVPFPLIQQSRFLRIRAHLYGQLKSAFFVALLPSFYVSLAILVTLLSVKLPAWSELSVAGLFSHWRVAMYVWLLAAQIVGNSRFMEDLFVILLTERHEFPIQGGGDLLTLADALRADQFKIIRELASLDLYTMGDAKNRSRRRELFSLSIPGGHPYNWRGVSEATMANVAEFTRQLVAAIDNVKAYEKRETNAVRGAAFQTAANMRSASQLAEKMAQRQMHENAGIRNMTHIFPGDADDGYVDQRPKILQRLPPPQDVQQGVENCLRTVKERFLAFPGIRYFLAEQHYARVYYVLRQSQRIVWLVQGISRLASWSLHEDEYGIVQKTLPAIVAQLLELKAVTDQVEAISVTRPKFRGHAKALRSAVKRSLYNVAGTFGDYLNDLILPDGDKEALMAYVYYREN